jgi:hypothetical protein
VRLRLLFLGVLATLLLGLALPAWANMAKRSERGDLRGILEPQDESQVRVDREELTFDVHPGLAAAGVKAVYHMTHTGTSKSALDVAFV